MNREEVKQLKNKPLPELQRNLVEQWERLRRLKFDLAAGKVKNIREIKATKKVIARILNEVNSRR